MTHAAAESNGKPRIVATYDYRDEKGELLYQSVRFDPKDFKVRRPNGRGGWYWNLGNARRVLYHLPELMAAPADRPVFVVEGEKDADNLRAQGLLATTNAMGAGKWQDEYTEALRGRHVIILPDNDDAGRRHAAMVAAAIQRVAASVVIVELPGLPPRGDVSDWLAVEGNDKVKLLNLVSSAAKKASHDGKASPAAEQTWGPPQPIPDDLPPVKPFNYELLPESVREFVSDVAERMQCPPDFPAVATIIAMAGAVGKKLGIRPKRHDDWLVVPNLWGAAIGRPSIMKTPAIRQPIKFLQRLQVEARKRYEQELRDYENICLVVEVQKKAKKHAIEEAMKKKQDPIQAAKKFNIQEPEEPTPKRYLVNDSTVEKLGALLNQNPMGLTVFRDELIGLLRQLDKEGQEGARAFYLEAWDGLGTFTYDRISRGTIHIESVTISILGGATPGRLLDYLGAAIKGGADDDGLMQRFQLAVYPDVNKAFRNVDRWPDTEAKQRAWEMFQRLDALDLVALGTERGDADDGVPFLHFSPEAQGLFDNWRVSLEERVRSGDEHPALESHLAKYRSLVPSLALLFHLADGAQGPVSEAATRMAIGWAAYLESHARRIYAIVVNAGAIAGKALAKRIQKGELKDGFTLRDIYRKHWAGLSDKQAVEQAVDLLLDLGWLKEIVENTGGKPKTRYQINPDLLAKKAPGPGAKSANSPADPSFGTFGTGHSARFQATPGDGGEAGTGEDGGETEECEEGEL